MNDWRDQVEEKKEYPKIESFKIKAGSASVVFKTEGFEWYDQANGKIYIIFKVQKDGDIIRPFFVNKENHPFLRQLKGFGKLTEREIILTRIGDRRATRWSATLPDEQRVESSLIE